MAEFIVTAATLQQKSEELTKLNSDLLVKSNEMEELVASLDAIWEGDAHDAFKSSFEKTRVALEKYGAAISKYSVQLTEISNEYIKTEATNTELAQSQA